MKAGELYDHEILTEAFGKTRVFQVCRHLRTLWPDFPRYQKKINNYHLAWIVFILSKSMNSTEKDVQKAILEGRELECDGQPFITWLGDLLSNFERIQDDIQAVYVYYSGDNFIEVTQRTSTKIFQGHSRANEVTRCARLPQDFLLQLSEMLQPYEDESLSGPEFEFDEKLHPDSRRKK